MNDTTSYNALVVTECADGTFSKTVQQQSLGDLPPGELLIRVAYSSLNYKDMLSATGNKGVTKTYPHVPGIDAAGVVEQSESDAFAPGDEVIVTSYDLGMNTPGGFGEYIRVPAAWTVRLPDGLSLRESMVLGTAGLTAGMCLEHIVATVPPKQGEILVTGATGGVGSMAVALLARLGYSVAAVTGKVDAHDWLKGLGASTILPREAVVEEHPRPMSKARWAGVVDTVGGTILAEAIKATQPGGVVTCCGMAASPELPLTVFPFILRGIRLIGIDSQHYPHDPRTRLWSMLGSDWKMPELDSLAATVSLDALSDAIDQMAAGTVRGRVLVQHTGR